MAARFRRRVRSSAAAVAAVVLMGSLAACGSDDDDSPATGDPSAISADRCATNKAAGKITYLSGYYWQASASILEVIAADQLGYFKDLCLDVDLQPGQGDTTVNAKLVQAGQVQVGPLSEQDIITSNASTVANGGTAKLLGISSYSNAGLDILMTMPSITSLKQLEGKSIGIKGYLPLSVNAMLGRAGVNRAEVKTIKVGYDPTILPRGQVDALTGFVSNEPNLLKADGTDVTVWKPWEYGVAGSTGTFAVNSDWAEAHPDTTADFMRAAFKAFQYCSEEAHIEECIGFQQNQSDDPNDDADHQTDVWTTESQQVDDNPVPGTWGSVDLKNVESLTNDINTYLGTKVEVAQATSWFSNEYVDKIVGADGKVVWPAP